MWIESSTAFSVGQSAATVIWFVGSPGPINHVPIIKKEQNDNTN